MASDLKRGSEPDEKDEVTDLDAIRSEITYSYPAELRCGISLVDGPWDSNAEDDR